MPERFKRPRQPETRRQKKQPSYRAMRKVLRTGPKKKIRNQASKLKKIPTVKLTVPIKEQATTLKQLSSTVQRVAIRLIRRNFLQNVHNSGILGLKFHLVDPSLSYDEKRGRFQVKLKGPDSEIGYEKGGTGLFLLVKKGPDGKTPVDAIIRGKLKIPGQTATSVNFSYNHAQRSFIVEGAVRLAKAGNLAGRVAQLDLRGSVQTSPTGGTTYSATGTYGNSAMQLQLQTGLTYHQGKVSYNVVGGLSVRF